jgi:class 3 adenylate cyclase
MDARERTRETERRRATVVFTDITGFTALSERLDPEEAYGIVSACLKLLDAIARKYGGNVDKYLGDCVMAVFGIPFALEDAERAAVNAAIEMHRRIHEFNQERQLASPLDIHTGINTGSVISGDVSGPVIREFSILGDAVNVASRLKDLAPRGRIWVGPETWRATRNEFEYRELESMKLKGKQQSVAVYELLSRQERLHRPAATSRTTLHTGFVGRARELGQLLGPIAEVAAGRGGVVRVVGEAGLGKSRLVAEARASEAAADLTWLEGRALAVGSSLSFHPFIDLLRSAAGIAEDAPPETAAAQLREALDQLWEGQPNDVVPFVTTLAGLAASESDAARLSGIDPESLKKLSQRAVAQVLRRLAARRPLVIALDDLHWADASSMELLGALLRLATTDPILFVLISRPEPQVEESLAQAHSERALPVSEIRLEPLSREASEDLIESLFRGGDLPRALRTKIEERAKGNPFYIEEVVRSLADLGFVERRDGALHVAQGVREISIPASVQEVILARVDRLPLDARQVLQIAAVVGRSGYQRILARTSGRDDLERVLARLTELQFLTRRERAGEVLYEFTHPLIQEATYGALSLESRRQHHARVAEAIEAELAPGTPGYHGMLAYHWGLARDAERAEKYLLAAGDEATRISASGEALVFFREAARLYVETGAGRVPAARRAALEQRLALAYFNRGNMVEGDRHFDRALRLLGRRAPRTPLRRGLRFASSLVNVLASLYLQRDLASRREATDPDREIISMMFYRAQAQVTADPLRFLLDTIETIRALTSVNPYSVPGAGGIYASSVGYFAYAGLSFGIGERLLRRAEATLDADDPQELALFQLMRFLHYLLQGDWDDRWSLDRQLVEENVRLGRLWYVMNYLPLETTKRIRQGRFAEAREYLEWIGKIEDVYGYELARSNRLGNAAFHELERRNLPHALVAAQTYYEAIDEELINLLALATRAEVEILLGDLEAAQESLDTAARLMRRMRFVPPFHAGAVWLARFWHDLVELESALGGGGEASEPRPGRRAIARLRAAARRSGRQALARARRVAWHRPETFRLLGRCAWLLDRRPRALAWYERALAEAEKLGMRPEAGRTWLEVGLRLAEPKEPARFRDLDAAACLERATEIFEELDLAWDLAQVEAARAEG